MKNYKIFIFLILSASAGIIKGALPLDLNLPDDPFWKEDAQEANANKDHFVEPADILNYTDYHYVGAHNAHVYPRFFKTVRQQDQTILGMLSYGVRGLMIDTYDGAGFALRGPKGSKVALSHGTPGAIAFTQKGHQSYQSLKYEMARIIEYMKANPKAIVTVIIENYANQDDTAREIAEVAAACKYDPILKPSDWQGKNTPWPTLGWMRQNNKRLVIFTQRLGNSAVTWSQFPYMIENQYSTTEDDKLCAERGESANVKKKRLLVAMNNFSAMAVTRATKDTKQQVSYDTLKRIVTNCQSKNFANGRIFNSYWADRIVDSCNNLYEEKQKTVFEFVNELNRIEAANLAKK